MKIKTILIFTLLITLAVGTFVFFNFHLKSKPKKTSGALQAMQFWTERRAYPNDDIIPDAYFRAYNLAKSNLKKINSNYQWQEIGPHNIGGRTLDVEFNPFNPNTIFAAAASGGIWRSYTAGVGVKAWTRIETGFPVLGVSSIAISPIDSNVILIGTGEVYNYKQALGGEVIRTTRGSYGIGILRTTNYGATWTKVLDWSYNQERGVNDVEFDKNNPNFAWAATTEGVFRSTDGGQTWDIVNNTIMAIDIAIHPDSSNIVFATFGNFSTAGHGIYKTTNFGATWQKLTNGLPATFGGKAHLSIHQANPQIIYASIGNGSSSGAGTWLCKSTNGGSTWSIVNTTDYATYQGWFSHWVGVHPTNENFVLAGGIDIWKSTDGGTNLVKKTDWAAWYFGSTPIGGPEGPPNYVHADQHSITFHPTNPNIIYFGTDGGVFRTTDGGETFQGCNGSYQTTQFYNGFSSADNNVNLAIGGMQDNATAIYQGSFAWYRVIGGDGCQTGINQNNTNILYGSSQYLSIYRSTNRGINWTNITPSSDNPAFVAPFVVCRSNPNVIYAGSRKLHKSTNGGTNWTAMNNNTAIDGNPILSIGVSATSTDTLYIATAPISSRAKVFRSTNGGVSFTNITGNLPDRYPDDIAVDPTNSKIVYIVFSGFGTSHLFKSTNGGESWIDIGSQLPDVPSSAIAINPNNPNQLFFGNDIGVYFSPDAGNNWYSVNNELPYGCLVIDINIPTSGDIVRVATHGNGVYQASLSQIISGIDEDEIIVKSFHLEQNYPNPFNPFTTIRFTIPDINISFSKNSENNLVQNEKKVTLKIYDVTGKEISTLVNETKQAGTYEVKFDASNLTSGVYFYQLKVGNYSETKKMVLLR
ncbi:MAG: T9SS type A sorting domain-containing protein [Ignavibacterium sp.]|nr:T9SS type A sorting domain-containing protein [Ignavibacterium sp.]